MSATLSVPAYLRASFEGRRFSDSATEAVLVHCCCCWCLPSNLATSCPSSNRANCKYACLGVSKLPATLLHPNQGVAPGFVA